VQTSRSRFSNVTLTQWPSPTFSAILFCFVNSDVIVEHTYTHRHIHIFYFFRWFES